MTEVLHWLRAFWALTGPWLAFLGGAVFTRWVLTPRYCPRCQYYLRWRLSPKHDLENGKPEEPWEVP